MCVRGKVMGQGKVRHQVREEKRPEGGGADGYGQKECALENRLLGFLKFCFANGISSLNYLSPVGN